MSIHIECYGQGQPLVLVHGWAMHSGVWRAFARQLAAHCQVICVDMPGHGQSGRDVAFDLQNVTQALLAAIPAERFSLLGWSLGASVAIEMAHQAPERVSHLLLLAGNPQFVATENWPGVAAKVLDNFAAQIQGDIQQMLNRFLALQVNGLPNGRSVLMQLKQSMLLPEAPSAPHLQGGLQVLEHADLRQTLSGVCCPVTLIQGDRDPLIPLAVMAAIKYIKPDCKTFLLKGAGHVPFLTHTHELQTRILQSIGANNLKYRIKRSFADAAQRYDSVADLQRQVALSLIERFPAQADPGWIMDLGCGTGFLGRHLPRHAEQQVLCSVDLALPMLVACAERAIQPAFMVAGDAEQLPFADQCFQQIYANLALQWCQDLTVAINEALRVLKPGGCLRFTTLADGTLHELKQAWAAVDDYVHVNTFLTVDEIQQAINQADCGRACIQQETRILYYPDVLSLMRELKTLGAHNVQSGRKRQATTRGQLQAVMNAYPNDAQGRVVASYKVVYISIERQL